MEDTEDMDMEGEDSQVALTEMYKDRRETQEVEEDMEMENLVADTEMEGKMGKDCLVTDHNFQNCQSLVNFVLMVEVLFLHHLEKRLLYLQAQLQVQTSLLVRHFQVKCC